jgi:hypothetical protein
MVLRRSSVSQRLPDVRAIPPQRGQDAFDGANEPRLVVRRIVRHDVLVGQRDAVPRALLVVDDDVLDVLSGADSEILIASPLQRRHVPRVLRVSLQRPGDAIPFHEILDWNLAGVEALDRFPETVEHSLWRSGRVEPFEALPLDRLDERRR